LKPIITLRGAELPAEPSARDTQDTLFIAGQEIEAAARSSALAPRTTSPVQIRTMEKIEAAGARGVSGKVAPQRRTRRHALAHLPSSRRAGGRQEHHVLRSEGHADHAMKAFFGSSVKNALLSVVFPIYRAQRRLADQLHFLRRQGHTRRRSVPQLQGQRV